MKEGYILGGGGGPDLDVITATAADVRSGKVIVDKDGNPLTGTEPERGNWTGSVEMNGKIVIPDGHHGGGGYVNGPAVTQRGAWNGAVGMNGKVTIPEGYHNGLGSVGGPSVPYQNADVSGTDRAYATGISAWSGVMCLGVRSGHYLNGVNWIHGSIPNLIAGNIKKGVNIAGLIGTYVYADITGWYYQPPNEMTGVTGGFSSRFNGGTSSSKPEEAEFTKQTTYMEARSNLISSSTSHGFYMGFVTNKKVDITNVRTIKFLMSGNSYYVGISNNQDDFFDSGIIGKVPASAYNGSYVDDNSPNILTVDTSMVSGSYYLAISCYASYGISSGNHHNRFRIHNIQYDTMA